MPASLLMHNVPSGRPARDPLTQKRAARAELEAKIEAEKTPKGEVKTFGECATAYIEAHKAGLAQSQV